MTTQEYLRSIGACEKAQKQVGSRLLKNAVLESRRGDWLFWLASKNMDQPGWTSRAGIIAAVEAVGLRFHVAAPFWWLSNLEALADITPATLIGVVQAMIMHAASIGGVPDPKRLEAIAEIARQYFDMSFLESLDK